MPKAIVTFGDLKDTSFVAWTRENLPKLIAQHLGVPNTDAGLSPEDIEVRFETIGPNDVFGHYLLAIEIRANDYPERRAILQSGTQSIWDAVNERFPYLNGLFFVWPLLGVGAFVDGPTIPP